MGDERERTGFVGLGAMGLPMVQNLWKAGYEPTVMSGSPGSVEEAVALGARPATLAQSVAEQSDIVVTMLPASTDVEAVVLGIDGVLMGAPPGSFCIDMSSIDPVTARLISERCRSFGVACLDARCQAA